MRSQPPFSLPSVEGWAALLAAVVGFTGVAFGAFGAHAVKDSEAKALIDLAARYQLIHALAVYAALVMRSRLAPPMFLVGTLLFCGSLYALALGAPHWCGAVTPLGGLSFLAGWAAVAAAALSPSRRQNA